MSNTKKIIQAAAGSAGGEALNVEGVFSTYLYEGTSTTQVIENGINLGQSYGSGSGYFSGSPAGLDPTGDGEYLQTSTSTDFALSNSDFTIEFFVNVSNGAGNNNIIFSFGAGTSDYDPLIIYTGITSTTADLKFYGSSSGTSWDFVSNAAIGTVSFGTWHHVALVRSGSSLYLFLDGVLGSTTSVSTTSFAQSANQLLIGRAQNDKRFYGYLSDFHYVKGTALYTSAFTPPTSTVSSVANTKLLTLQQSDILSNNSSSGHTVTENDGTIKNSTFGPFDAADAGEGGFVWVKSRNGSYSHYVFYDNGTELIRLETNETYGEAGISPSIFTSMNSSGFTIGSHGSVNGSGTDYASYSFRKAPKFMDMVFYSGQSSNSMQVSHSLDHTVGAIICKKRNTSGGWAVYHRSLGTGNYITLNDNFGSTADSNFFPAVTSTYFQPGSDSDVGSGNDYIAFVFAHHDGDGDFGPDGDQDAIKCDSYTGNGSTDGPEVNLGFEPQWLLIKRADGTDSWQLLDNMRGIVTNGNDAVYNPNNFVAEDSSNPLADLTSTGFKIRSVSGAVNNSGEKYIYIAIRRGPMAVPESATDVFAINTKNGTTGLPSWKSGFTTDLFFYRDVDVDNNWYAAHRLTYPKTLQPNTTNGEGTTNAFDFDYMNGVGGYSTSDSTEYGWMWKRAPSFFDMVTFSGNSTAGRTISHNLGVAPEMMIVKRRSAGASWTTYVSDLGATKYLRVNNSNAAATSSAYWNNTAPTSSVFTLGSDADVNGSTENYIAYLFASLDGVSKVGSYTGNGSTQTIDCGFSAGARFVLIKRTDSAGSWFVWDSERGIVSGSEPFLMLDQINAEQTGSDEIDPDNSGFTVNQSFYTDNNVSGGTYIFYAVA